MASADRAMFLTGVAALVLGAGALVWRGAETSATASGMVEDKLIATVDVISLLEDGLQQDSVNTERETLRTALFARLEGMQNDLQSQAEILQATPQDDPQYGALVQEFQQRQGQLQQASQEAGIEFEALSARQAAETYAKVHTAAKSVALREGFKYVVASRSDAALGVVQNLTNVTQQVLARPVVHGGTDLTELVFAELGFVKPVPPPTFPDDSGAVESQPAPASPGEAGSTTSSPGVTSGDGGMKPLNPAPRP